MKIFKEPIFETNFQFVLEGPQSLLVVDPGHLPTIQMIGQKAHKPVTVICVTHEHHDHIAALNELVHDSPAAQVFGLKLKSLSHFTNLSEVQEILWEDQTIQILKTPGHTKNQVAYHFPQLSSLFSGDLIFQMGCGRIFDGTFEEQFESLQSLRKLPLGTQIFCSHDYSETNYRFTQQYCQPSFTPVLNQIPLSLQTEIQQNSFLTEDFTEFKRLRELRNHFL